MSCINSHTYLEDEQNTKSLNRTFHRSYKPPLNEDFIHFSNNNCWFDNFLPSKCQINYHMFLHWIWILISLEFQMVFFENHTSAFIDPLSTQRQTQPSFVSPPRVCSTFFFLFMYTPFFNVVFTYMGNFHPKLIVFHHSRLKRMKKSVNTPL